MSLGKSPIARTVQARRAQLHATTNGRCFYCGFPLRLHDELLERDWLLPAGRYTRMVVEHKMPIIRGGGDDADNHTPACAPCNSAKASLTLDEFRLVRGLRAGNPTLAFYGEEPTASRDWLCCHSREFERVIFARNYPHGVKAYARGKLLRKSRPPFKPRGVA